jgi:hypothetical protein
MSKAIVVFVALVFSLPSIAAEEAGTSRNQDEPNLLADMACLDAIAYLAEHDYERSDKPLSAMALAHVRRCNGHPNKGTCETTSRIMMREYGKTPFTCGSDTADYSMPVIVPEHPLLLRPDNPPPK